MTQSPSTTSPARRVDVVFNRSSGVGRAEAVVSRLLGALRDAGHACESHTLGDWMTSAAPLPDVVVMLGGDGTARAVAERVDRERGAAPESESAQQPESAQQSEPAQQPGSAPTMATAPELLMIPRGTANLLAMHLGARWRADSIEADVVDAIARGPRRAIDLAHCNALPMLLMCGVGFDADVVHDLAARRSGPITKWTYLGPIVRRMRRFVPADVRVRVDGIDLFGPGPAMVVVANVREYGAGFPIVRGADATDGLLDVLVIPMPGLVSGIVKTGAAVLGQLHRTDAIETRGREVTIEGTGNVQVDGEAFGQLPVTIRATGRQLTWVTPVR